MRTERPVANGTPLAGGGLPDETPGTSALPLVLTVDELAALLRVDRKSVYSAIQRGEIPGVRRLGRTVRLHRDTVLRWLSQGQDRARSRRSR